MLKYREPLKVDSADESSLILPRELRDGEGGGYGGKQAGYALHRHTLFSLFCLLTLLMSSANAILIRASGQ